MSGARHSFMHDSFQFYNKASSDRYNPQGCGGGSGGSYISSSQQQVSSTTGNDHSHQHPVHHLHRMDHVRPPHHHHPHSSQVFQTLKRKRFEDEKFSRCFYYRQATTTHTHSSTTQATLISNISSKVINSPLWFCHCRRFNQAEGCSLSILMEMTSK